jgi:hypothetical protein
MEWERLSVSMYLGNQFKEVRSSGEKVGWNVVSKERRQTFMPVSHPITNIARRLEGQSSMAKCEVCGNDYDKSFSVEANGRKHVFDSFECAIRARP